jgi:hypothetical protein
LSYCPPFQWLSLDIKTLGGISDPKIMVFFARRNK